MSQVLLRGCRSVEIDVWDGRIDDDSSGDEAQSKEAHRGIRERLGLRKTSGLHEEHHQSFKDRLLGRNDFEKSAKTPNTSSSLNISPEDVMSQRITPWRSGVRVEPRVLHGQYGLCAALTENH